MRHVPCRIRLPVILCRQNANGYPAHMHNVARLPFQFGVLRKQLWIMSRTIPYIVPAAHDAEHATKSLVAQRIGVMRLLTCIANAGEHFVSQHFMDR